MLAQGDLEEKLKPDAANAVEEAVKAVLPDPQCRPLELTEGGCPAGAKRLFYDYLLGFRPTYKSEFHLNRLLQNLIWITAQRQSRPEVAAEQIRGLYPAGSDRRISECLAWAIKCEKKMREYCGWDFGYPKERVFLEFLQPRTEKAKADAVCRYCPHCAYCLNKRNPGQK